MTTRLRKVITAIDANGKPFSEIHRETEVNGKWYPDDPVPLSQAGPDSDVWKTTFNAAVLAENESLKTTLATIATDHEATLADLRSQIASLTAERDAALAQIPPVPGPREVTPAAVLGRIRDASPNSLQRIWSSELEIAALAAATLFTWPGMINLDSPLLAQLLGGLTQAGLLTADEVAKILE